MSTQPDWYDVLGVAPEADKDTIRAAWKKSVADLDPTSASFRVFNQAAEVLLDDERRAAYDRTRDAGEEVPLDQATAAAAAELSEPVAAADGTTVADGGTSEPRKELPGPTTRIELNLRLIAVAWAALLVAVLAWTAAPGLGEWTAGKLGDDSSGSASPQQLMATQAQAAAIAAVGPVLAYDYRTLEQDKAAATALMTDDFKATFEQFFAVVAQSAPPNKTVVRVDVLDSGVGTVTEDSVDVLIFVNRPTLNKARTTPYTYYDQVTLTMQLVDGDWLVGDMRVEPPKA